MIPTLRTLGSGRSVLILHGVGGGTFSPGDAQLP